MANNYITSHGFNKLRSELENLLKVERPEVTRVVKWAASLGDRSENADYKYGKKKLREIDKRIRFLTKRIDDSVVVDPKDISSDKIQFGATVKVEDEEGNQRIFSIVGADEIEPQRGLISWKSPIGKALIGKEEGDDITVRTPNGNIEYIINSVEYIPINFSKED